MAKSSRRPAKRRSNTDAKQGRGRPPVYSWNEILQVAKIAFSQHGYANVTLDELATRLNTGKGTIYYHSNRKVDLLITIARTHIGASIPELGRIHALKATADVRFVMAMRSLMDTILSDQHGAKIYFENESDLPAPIRNELRSLRRQIEQVFVQIVSDGVRSGIFRGNPKTTVRHAMAVALWPYRWYSPSGRLSKAEFIDEAIDFALSALKAGSSIHSVMNPVSTLPAAPRSPKKPRK